jgi:hypothetical protein
MQNLCFCAATSETVPLQQLCMSVLQLLRKEQLVLL